MPPITRRDVLKAAAAGLIPLLPGCGGGGDGGEDDAPPIAVAFDHGVASGDPLSDAVILWTRVAPLQDAVAQVPVQWQVARDAQMSGIVASGTATARAEADYTVKIDATGLQPGQIYHYRFSVGDTHSPVGRTRTAPVGSVERLSFAFVTCSDYSRGYFNVYRRVAARDDLQAVIHLGDYIYENGAQDRVRPQLPPRELLELADYRTRYAAHRSDPDLQELHRQHPMIWIWDDHEVVNNSWRDGAEAHDSATQGEYAARRAAAFRAAHEWMPIRTPDTSDLSIIYRPFVFGDLVELLMIDARQTGRDQPAPLNELFGVEIPVFTQTGEFADPERQILGATQESWLIERLAASTARWRILGNQVYFSPLKLLGAPRATNLSLFLSNDKWDGYEPARDRVLEAMRATRNVVVMTGDAHEAYAFDITPDPNNPFAYEAISGNGSLGVEFVVSSTTSRGDAVVGDSLSAVLERIGESAEQLLRLTNPHLKYYENRRNGYVLLGITPQQTQAEFWFVPEVGAPNDTEALDATFVCEDGSARLQRA